MAVNSKYSLRERQEILKLEKRKKFLILVVQNFCLQNNMRWKLSVHCWV